MTSIDVFTQASQIVMFFDMEQGIYRGWEAYKREELNRGGRLNGLFMTYLFIFWLFVPHKCLVWLAFVVILLILCRHNAI